MIGKITKMQGGVIFAYSNANIFPCEVKGNVKKQDKILVGDNVELVKDEYAENKYIITALYPRKNELLRPAIANLDTLFIVCATSPKPDFMLLDKLIIYCNLNNIEPVLVINKSDIASESELAAFKRQYNGIVKIIVASAKQGEGVDEIKNMLINKTCAFTGQSAVGKSTLINAMCPNLNLNTNGLSSKIERGKHTTRHNELFVINQNQFIADTPGFSMLSLKGVNYNNLHQYYTEFNSFEDKCAFRGCTHISCTKDVCGVVNAVENGHISENRYSRYKKLYLELKEREEWKYD